MTNRSFVFFFHWRLVSRKSSLDEGRFPWDVSGLPFAGQKKEGKYAQRHSLFECQPMAGHISLSSFFIWPAHRFAHIFPGDRTVGCCLAVTNILWPRSLLSFWKRDGQRITARQPTSISIVLALQTISPFSLCLFPWKKMEEEIVCNRW